MTQSSLAPAVLTSAAGADADPDSRQATLLSVAVLFESSDQQRWSAENWSVSTGFEIEAAIAQAVDAVGAWPGLISAPSEAAIALLSDAEVAALNASYRKQAKPTNVLSFPAPAAAIDYRALAGAEPANLGDIALAEETILKEAEDLGIPPLHHLQHLVVHGLLHLLGYDHETVQSAEEMEALEVAILTSIGVPDPYAGTDLAPAAHRLQQT